MSLFDGTGILQSTVDLFAELFGATLVVFNKEGYRIAATGHFKTKINEWGPEEYPALVAIRTKKRIEILNPTHDPACEGCIYTAVCDKKTAVHTPLLYDEKVLGSLSYLWYRRTRPEQYKDYMQYLEQLLTALLLEDGGPQNGKDAFPSAGQRDMHRFSALASVIQESILLLDANSCIREINDQAVRLCDQPRYALIGRHIHLDFPEMPTFGVQEQYNEPVFLRKAGKTYNLRCSTRYIRQGGVRHTMIIAAELVSILEDYPTAQDMLSFDSILGSGRALTEVLDTARKVAKSGSTILIRGESGTGKELVAQAIHRESIRSAGPFVAINCSAIPGELLESELFGYVGGTFTGALKGGKVGLLQTANNGTLFLDEIGDMSYPLQAKLLRVIEAKKIKKLGSSIEEPVNIRIIAATNQDLEQMMLENRFRQDLYYRLNVIPLTLPPLRERREDIPVLVEHFIRLFDRECAKRINGTAPGVMRFFQQYDWPGNVRELQNVIEFAVNVEPSENISLATVAKRFPELSSGVQAGSLKQTVERQIILSKLEEYGWSTVGKTQAARDLGIGRSTLYRKIAQLGIQEDSQSAHNSQQNSHE